MNNLVNWIMGAFAAVLAVCGLFVASNAGHGVGYWGGLLFSLFALGFVFLLIKVSFDHSDG